jgi:PD-(D/E)XK endonuclease
VDVGDRTEAVVIAALVRRGYRLLRPLSANQLFIVHCPETDRIYAVPVGESGVLKAASLRVSAPANNQARGIRWAADYELPA